jgi:hypothetical protein
VTMRIYLRVGVISAKSLGGGIESCWRCVFSISPKIKGLG